MENLIDVIDRLQAVFNSTRLGDLHSEIQLPKIVVIGAQSAGKSSVLEGIVGKDFLPRGTGIVTRRPLILHLNYCKKGDQFRQRMQVGPEQEFALFKHDPNRIYTNFEEVREEIDADTDRVAGRNKGICPLPITLTIYSHRVIKLSLVDLPGITKVPIGDQPKDIEKQIRALFEQYIHNPHTLILAVTAANQDFATSEAIKIAQEFDPEGERTLAVLTKLDLMDKGTNARRELNGQVIPIKCGIIGVKNRSQEDINHNKTIEECWAEEECFFRENYPEISQCQGIRFLAKTLQRLLLHHIRECLPQLKLRISTMMLQYQKIMRAYGEPVVDKHRTLLQVITQFASAYNSTIDGTARNIETTELCGGARICYIFHETFANALEKLNPMEHLTQLDILTAIKNATGTRPALFVPEVSFELLVKRQIRRLEEPSLNCVDLVYEEMIRIVQHCGFEIQQEMFRFPKLSERIHEVISNVLSGRLIPTKEFVSNLVSVQLAYINSKHPEFASDAALINALQEAPSNSPFHSNAGSSVVATEVNGIKRHPPPMPPTMPDSIPHLLTNGTSASASDFGSSTTLASKDGGPLPSKFNPAAWFGGRAQPSTTALMEVDSADGMIVSRATEKTITRTLSTREKRDCAVIERLIKAYFLIVRKTIQDMVPKAIMNFLVNYIRENLQSELVRQLYNADDMDSLLAESEMMAQKRAETTEMLEALIKANQVINEIREVHIW